MRAGHGGPLFVCHANCCRSVLAYYLYRHLCNNAPALSAGLEVGERINDRAERMLRESGIDASAHRPLKLSRDLCDEAIAIVVMGPSYLHRVIWITAKTLQTRGTCSPIRPGQCLSTMESTRFSILRSTIDRP